MARIQKREKTDFQSIILNIFLRVFVQYFLCQEKFIGQKLVLFFFFIPSPYCQKNSKN